MANLVTIREIQDMIKEAHGWDIPEQTVSRWAKRGDFGTEVWERGRKRFSRIQANKGIRELPDKDNRRKITDAEVADICASTEPLTVVAMQYGISPSYVSMLRNGRRRTTEAAE